MSTSPRALLLDFDGTLADSITVMKSVYQRFLENFQCVPTHDEFNSLNGLLLHEVVHCIKRRHALKEDKEALLSLYNDMIDNAYTNVKANIGALTLIKKAHAQNCTIGIVTSNSKGRVRAWLDEVGFLSKIDFIVAKDDVKDGKPFPEPYLLATKKTTFKPDEIVAIEDSLHGAMSATCAGLRTFVIDNKIPNYGWPKKAEVVTSLTHAADQLWS